MSFETADYDDCPPHRHACLGPGLEYCEKNQQLLVEVDKVMGAAGLDDADPAAWEDLALTSYRAVDAVRALPIPCWVILRRGTEERFYQVDVRFSTKGENHGEG